MTSSLSLSLSLSLSFSYLALGIIADVKGAVDRLTERPHPVLCVSQALRHKILRLVSRIRGGDTGGGRGERGEGEKGGRRREGGEMGRGKSQNRGNTRGSRKRRRGRT
jgi:hypothetical protein